MTKQGLLFSVFAAVCGSGLFSVAAVRAEGLSGRDIMEKVTTTRKLDGSESTIKMSIFDEKGQAREREIASATKLFDGGKTEKRVFRFLSPADVQGTGILIFDYETKADDMWIFLPALRKTRRILSSQGSQSFMGSEFSYSDLNIPALDDFTYTVGKDEACGGDTCYVVDVMPKSKETAANDGYSKKTYWVSKSKFVVMRGLFYAQDGKLLKELLTRDVKLLDAKNKRYRTMRMEMINKQNGRRSVFESTKMTFAPTTKDEYFTTTYIERG
jgi:outer membrane lipoprotein-sorting protein